MSEHSSESDYEWSVLWREPFAGLPDRYLYESQECAETALSGSVLTGRVERRAITRGPWELVTSPGATS